MKQIPVRQIKTSQDELASHGRFTIRRIEDIMKNAELVHNLHRHDFYFILCLHKGKGIHEIDFKEYKVSNNSIFILRPGQVHQLNLKPGCTGYLAEFDSGFYHPIDKSAAQRLRRSGNKNFCQPDQNRFKKLHDILAIMFEQYRDKEEGYQDATRSALDIFFIEYLRQSPHPNSIAKTAGSYSQERYEEFIELMEKNIATHKQVAQYTALMNLSAYQLNEITKTTVDKTASELINEHIILEAKRHLLATSNQVKDIADRLGYEDVSYFIRFFKKQTGDTPETFRQHFK